MRLRLLLALCGLLACHSARQSVTPSSPPPSAPAPAVASGSSSELRDALIAVEHGDFARGLPALRRLWGEGHRTQDLAASAAYAAASSGESAEAFTWMERAVALGYSDVGGLLHDAPLVPLRSLSGYDALVARARQNAVAARLAGNVGAGLEKTSPREAGLSESALAELLKQAEDSGSSALVLLRHGKLVGEWYFGGETQRIEAMSATKAVVALAIGLLIDDGRIPSADTPVSTFFPEWKDGLAAKVTLRHLLSHTSGLAANRTTQDIHQSKDFVRYALESQVVDAPGSRFFYNNKAVNLLAGVVERASGEKLDAYLMRRLFAPLGIRDVAWQKDPSGNPLGMSGLRLHPLDFAKVGQLLLQKGLWRGQRVLSEAWVRECTAAPSQPHNPNAGLLWWLVYAPEQSTLVLESETVAEARRNGMPEEALARLADLVGRPMPTVELRRILSERLGMPGVAELLQKSERVPLRPKVEGPPRGFAAMGQAGQMLVVLPGEELVAVRMAVPGGRVPGDVLEFSRFPSLLMTLVPPKAPAAAPR